MKNTKKKIAFIGTVGIPNRYGGFESFLEHCAPIIAKSVDEVIVTCDASAYENQAEIYNGVSRMFIPLKANGISSIFHDLYAFIKVLPLVSHIVVLGVSGGIWFPLFRLLCWIMKVHLSVNVDGVEWRRSKFSWVKRKILKLFDFLAQKCSNKIVYDNEALLPFVLNSCKSKAILISYSGDHVLRLMPKPSVITKSALTICRVEPENQVEMLIEGMLASHLTSYTFVGNWNNSLYGRLMKERYKNEKRIVFSDPIYDAGKLAELRETHEFYLHGHSVGGTNPSLVEMLFYDNKILCFDCTFNRATAGSAASYFQSSNQLSQLINTTIGLEVKSRNSYIKNYTSQRIAKDYLQMLDFIH
ncbi:DUF1972 domain-containing protein [Undibacterium oligocarboniphilum]|uniref:DUF1972 domain-containing protein n=1 Tax=Undibacterium oligocarboniphilum TaxID=666702 RepID=A0A850QJJ3_9BURK|nr:DUF1972 domain-containing protein [Undibacterium oligocarboniphilum]MBC3868950.1 DUF1972 domain-containing protein [Undibacterium oligocarboniphilum]NVO76930.1 DUF1972 domain-containing protein [Undibacterium oligocarboniphilum]